MDVRVAGSARIGRVRRALVVAVAASLALGVTGAVAAPRGPGSPADVAASGAQGGPPVTVMTRNVYLGAELTPVFAARNETELVAATSTVWGDVLASDFPARAAVLADEVARDRPLLVGLQEVSRWSAVGAGGATEIDFLAILLDALAVRGLHYDAVSVSEAFTGQLPAVDPDLGLVNVTLVDRDVVLVRADVPPAQLTVLDEGTGRFDAALTLPVLGAPLRVERGWNRVDVRVRDRTFRFVNSHLEAFDPDESVRVQQAQELLDGPLATDLPVVLLGDVNSDAEADGRAYRVLTDDGGFVDAWPVANPGVAGLTCCHAADLRNDTVALRSRIDLVLVRGGVRVRDAEVIGVDPASRTPSGLWPSDHAGVVARVMVTAR